jgi:hypothetical protein
MGGGTMLITLISPGSPVPSFSGESRTFKASVNMDDPIVRWKLDGVLVQEHIPQEYMDLPANTELSYTTTASFGIHELEIEAEKDGVLVSNSWIWNVDRVVNNCSNTYLSNSGEIYIKITDANLHQRSDGSYYVDVDWFVHGCQTTAQRAANGEIMLPLDGPCCEMIITVGVSWDYIGQPGEPSPFPDNHVQEINLCSKSGSSTFEISNNECRVFVKLHTECFAYLISEAIPPYIPAVVIPIRVCVAEENGSCSCNL